MAVTDQGPAQTTREEKKTTKSGMKEVRERERRKKPRSNSGP
jgi:hypothetical protein